MGSSLGITNSEIKMNSGTDTADSTDSTNGYVILNKYFLPEELIIAVLSHVPPKDLLKCSLVCKEWDRIVKSTTLWCEIYKQVYGKSPKKLPWYLFYIKLTTDFFDTNLIKNTNGDSQFKHWKICEQSGDGFRIESEPQGAQPLPPSADFNGRTSCFATSYGKCSKQQIIKFNGQIFKDIFMVHKPAIVASDWCAPRFDCACRYQLIVKLVSHDKKTKTFQESLRMAQWTEGQWKKVEMIIDDYTDIAFIVFQHEGQDSQFWKGHYGPKMAGSSVKVLFDSIEA